MTVSAAEMVGVRNCSTVEGNHVSDRVATPR